MPSISFDIKEVGTIIETRKIIARVSGLPTCSYGQPLTFSDGSRGMVVGFDKTEALALLFHEGLNLKAGDSVVSRAESLKVPVGEGFIGRIVNGLGDPCDGREAIKPDEFRLLFPEAPGITERAALTRQLYTGVNVLDAMIPIAKGQRELIIGDRVTGKTALGVDAILAQKGRQVICIYCCIGRSFNSLAKIVQTLQEKEAFQYTMVVAATADSPPGEQYLSPYTAACLGEYFMRKGRDVLVVFDDLSKHAWTYRQISLLMDRSPGREAYPGDIFFIHSQLVERAAQLSPELGGGSMTFLPIIEIQQGDVTGYISTNLISMTDGQIFLSSELFQDGFKPSVDPGLSVSRVGGKMQTAAARELCSSMRLDYVQYRELLNITKLRSIISKETQMRIKRGEALVEILIQDKNEPHPYEEQILQFYAVKSGILDEVPKDLIKKMKKNFYPFVKDKYPKISAGLATDVPLSFALKDEMSTALREYLKTCGWTFQAP